MIHDVFKAIQGDINRFLKSKHNISEDKVVVSSLMNADGSVAVQEPDKIVLSLINIEMDRTQSNIGSYKKMPRGGFVKDKPPVNVNLTVLFAAYFTTENYLEGLKFIASVIAYFQSNSGLLTPQNLPALNGVAEKLQAELLSPDSREVSNMWSQIGAKYLPSAIYKVRTLPIKHELPTTPTPIIKQA